MLKIRQESKTIYIPLHEIKEITMEETKVTIVTSLRTYETDDIKYVTTYIKNRHQSIMPNEMEHLAKTVRDIWELLRARLR